MNSLLKKRVLGAIFSVLSLSLGWLGVTGVFMLVAFVPLLWISGEAEDSRRGWWSVFMWALIIFVGWNLSTIWWIGYATPVGPVAATLASSFYSMLAFMTFHTVSKRAPKSLAYTVFVSFWIACEYFYMDGDFSWPWLLIGNGFSNDIALIQWYEYTGIFGGSLWVLLSNLFVYEALQRGGVVSRWLAAAIVIISPIVLSVAIYFSYSDSEQAGSMEISIIQPNVDCYDLSYSDGLQEDNLVDLLDDVPASSQLVLMPEGSVPGYHWEHVLDRVAFFDRLRGALSLDATLIFGTYTRHMYGQGEARSDTARPTSIASIYYDLFNTAVAIDKSANMPYRHKSRLVIGVENTPTWVFKIFSFFVVELGDNLGQVGKGVGAELFEVDNHKVGTAICYEALYGGYYREFIKNGAQIMSIISNDCWWRDTVGHKHLYSLSAVRAVETRRAIARSANTGTSGFITARGDSIDTMGWGERGVMTHWLALSRKMTIYTIYGDYIAYIMTLLAGLSLLYYVAYRARRGHHLV